MKLLQHRGWLIVGLTVLFILGVRVHLRDMPLERDEGEYAYAGQLILHGVAPYKEAYNMKLPGTYAAYALIMAVFGQTPAGVHFGLALVNIGCIVLLFLVGRELLDEMAGAVAAAVFGLLSTSPSILGLAGHATHFVVLPVLVGILLLLKSPTSDSPGVARSTRGLFLSGLFLGLAFLMKQQGVFFGLFGLLYVVAYRLYEPQVFKARMESAKRAKSRAQTRRDPAEAKRERVNLVEESEDAPDIESVPKGDETALGIRAASRSSTKFNPWGARVPPIAWRTLKKEAAIFVGGLALPYVAICLLLACVGAFPQFVFWTITYAKEYASSMPLVNATDVFKTALKAVVGANFLLWLLPWVGMAVMWWDRRLGVRERFFLIAFFFCALASTAVGLYFRAHYFITLLPALGLLAGEGVSRAVRLLKHDNTIELFLALPILALAFFGALASVIGNGQVWFTPAGEAPRTIYSTTLFSEASPIGHFIRTNSTPQTRVAVLGSEPEIYFYSRRKGATGYIYTYPLMEDQPYARRMQEEMIAEIERNKPGYVVYVDEPLSWLKTTNSEQMIFQWWKGYWSSNLDLVKTFQVLDEPEEGPTNTYPILLLKRRETAGGK